MWQQVYGTPGYPELVYDYVTPQLTPVKRFQNGLFALAHGDDELERRKDRERYSSDPVVYEPESPDSVGYDELLRRGFVPQRGDVESDFYKYYIANRDKYLDPLQFDFASIDNNRGTKSSDKYYNPAISQFLFFNLWNRGREPHTLNPKWPVIGFDKIEKYIVWQLAMQNMNDAYASYRAANPDGTKDDFMESNNFPRYFNDALKQYLAVDPAHREELFRFVRYNIGQDLSRVVSAYADAYPRGGSGGGGNKHTWGGVLDEEEFNSLPHQKKADYVAMLFSYRLHFNSFKPDSFIYKWYSNISGPERDAINRNATGDGKAYVGKLIKSGLDERGVLDKLLSACTKEWAEDRTPPAGGKVVVKGADSLGVQNDSISLPGADSLMQHRDSLGMGEKDKTVEKTDTSTTAVATSGEDATAVNGAEGANGGKDLEEKKRLYDWQKNFKGIVYSTGQNIMPLFVKYKDNDEKKVDEKKDKEEALTDDEKKSMISKYIGEVYPDLLKIFSDVEGYKKDEAEMEARWKARAEADAEINAKLGQKEKRRAERKAKAAANAEQQGRMMPIYQSVAGLFNPYLYKPDLRYANQMRDWRTNPPVTSWDMRRQLVSPRRYPVQNELNELAAQTAANRRAVAALNPGNAVAFDLFNNYNAAKRAGELRAAAEKYNDEQTQLAAQINNQINQTDATGRYQAQTQNGQFAQNAANTNASMWAQGTQLADQAQTATNEARGTQWASAANNIAAWANEAQAIRTLGLQEWLKYKYKYNQFGAPEYKPAACGGRLRAYGGGDAVGFRYPENAEWFAWNNYKRFFPSMRGAYREARRNGDLAKRGRR